MLSAGEPWSCGDRSTDSSSDMSGVWPEPDALALSATSVVPVLTLDSGLDGTEEGRGRLSPVLLASMISWPVWYAQGGGGMGWPVVYPSSKSDS